MAPLWGRPLRRWRSRSTQSTPAPSAARTRWRGKPLASGGECLLGKCWASLKIDFPGAVTRTAWSRWLEVPTLTPPPLQPPSGENNWHQFHFLQQHSVFPPDVGESNFSCCKTIWSSIHRINFHVDLDHYGSYTWWVTFLLLCIYLTTMLALLTLAYYRSAVRRLREMKEA